MYNIRHFFKADVGSIQKYDNSFVFVVAFTVNSLQRVVMQHVHIDEKKSCTQDTEFHSLFSLF